MCRNVDRGWERVEETRQKEKGRERRDRGRKSVIDEGRVSMVLRRTRVRETVRCECVCVCVCAKESQRERERKGRKIGKGL